MKSARAANAAVACEFDDVLGGWMSPTAATCMTPPRGGVMARGELVVARDSAPARRWVVVGGDWVVVVGGSDDDVVEATARPLALSILRAGGRALLCASARPAGP